MFKLLNKEMKLTSSILSYIFILFSFMFLLPGYPILCSVFFVTLGLFQSYQNARESNDIVFSALLPVAKKDIVKGKYLFTCLIEGMSLFIMALCVILRMTVFKDSIVYRTNALMNANLFALGIAFLIFGLFNESFVCGFFKTGYKFGKPFLTYIIVSFAVLGLAETLHHLPNLEMINAFGKDHIILQLFLLFLGQFLYIILTVGSFKKAYKVFEKVDL